MGFGTEILFVLMLGLLLLGPKQLHTLLGHVAGFEPPYLVTRWSRPNSKLTILNEGVLFQDIAFVPEPSDHGFDIFYFPAQDRTLQCSEIRTFAIRILCPPTLMTSAY